MQPELQLVADFERIAVVEGRIVVAAQSQVVKIQLIVAVVEGSCLEGSLVPTVEAVRIEQELEHFETEVMKVGMDLKHRRIYH